MKSFSESEIKYLAGLLDADGCLSLNKYNTAKGTFVRLELALAASESIDRHGYIFSLGERAGNVTTTKYTNGWSASHKWRVGKTSELNQLLPRIIKHMVIKGAHWNRLYNFYLDNKGSCIGDFDVREFSEASRKETGPIKAKSHPTWAWVAGYLDGDGSYSIKGRVLRMSVVCQDSDVVGIHLLHKAFGGQLYNYDNDYPRWKRNLGPSDSQFAVNFLKKVHRHSRLKKHKIEQMLAFHNQPQRLSESIPTGKAIV